MRTVRLLRQYDPYEVTLRTAVDCSNGRCLVQQQFKDEQDVNTIVRRFGLSQVAPAAAAAGVYGDFTGIVDYESAVSVVRRAQAGFNRLPPEVREKFYNDPGELVAFAQNVPEDVFRAELGLAPVSAPVAAPVAAEGAPAPSVE